MSLSVNNTSNLFLFAQRSFYIISIGNSQVTISVTNLEKVHFIKKLLSKTLFRIPVSMEVLPSRSFAYPFQISFIKVLPLSFSATIPSQLRDSLFLIQVISTKYRHIYHQIYCFSVSRYLQRTRHGSRLVSLNR